MVETCSVDLKMRGLRGSIKEYCSSFIDEQVNGDIEFVHQSARRYIQKDSRVGIENQHMQVARICLALLAGPGFVAAQSTDVDKLKQYVLSGYYSFATYAVAHWASHVSESVRHLTTGVNWEALGKLLDLFLRHNFTKPAKPCPLEQDLQHYPETLRDSWPRLQDIQMAMSAAARQLHSQGPNSATNEVLCLPEKLRNAYVMIEKTVSTTSNGLDRLYGKSVFKCPRMSCMFFSEGFSSAAVRDAHVAKHERPFRCTKADCERAEKGFKSRRELRNHLDIQHSESCMEEKFPILEDFKVTVNDSVEEPREILTSAAPKAKFVCEYCSQTFTRNSSMRTHVASKHTGTKRYQCYSCGVSFARTGDLARHDRNIHKGQKPFECWGRYGEVFFEGPTWGCGESIDIPQAVLFPSRYLDSVANS